MKKWLLVLIVRLLTGSIAIAATYYMPDDCGDLRECINMMSGGDELVIRDGTYSGEENTILRWSPPPNGTNSHFTTIKAEHDGRVLFVDGFLAWSGPPSSPVEYVSFEGLTSLQETIFADLHHCKFLRCGFTYNNLSGQSASAPFWVGGSCSYLLIEDCWAWGAGRYKFVTGGDHNIFRRCVARFDRTDWHDPMANFSSYDGDYILFQNCIAIDTDHPEFWLNTQEKAGNFYIHHGAAYNVVEGCVGINNTNYFIGGSPGQGLSIKNNIAANTGYGIQVRADWGLANGYNIENCTFVNIHQNIYSEGDGVDTWYGNDRSVSSLNCLYYGIEDIALKGGNLGGSDTGYNVFYNNGIDHYGNDPVVTDYCAANDNAIDPIDGSPGNGIPALKYLSRIEDGSDLDGAASDGGDIGATVLYKIGRSGTLWGEEGYNETTDEPLWPWPNEDRIKKDMAAYTYTGETITGTIETLTGKRGFCADGTGLYGGRITLTSYIWEYLGNPCPVDVCDYYDVNRDGHVNVQDTQIVANHILGIATSENADTTGDGSVTIQDVQGVVNVILAGTQG